MPQALAKNGKDCKGLSLLWLRRDLRLHDHAALAHALREAGEVQPVFVFDTDVLARFPNPQDRRLSFIADALVLLEKALRAPGGGLVVAHGRAQEIIPRMAEVMCARRVIAAEDYEPSARMRDEAVKAALARRSIDCAFVKDQVIFAPYEILREADAPYKVYTPYAKAWRARFAPACMGEYAIIDQGRYAQAEVLRSALLAEEIAVLSLENGARAFLAQIGYQHQSLPLWPVDAGKARLNAFAQHRMQEYATGRDRMGKDGTSALSPYLRFGLISIREAMRAVWDRPGAEKWIGELIWREFYAMILWHYPKSVNEEWNTAYRGLEWRKDAEDFNVWQEGKTGYPVVDAAMRQLLQTGWMHNRARMVVASFLTKHLRIDWRLGEEYFAQVLMDYEQASNVGGWQWAASTGTDAQPYFRVFNPVLQGQKFDPKGEYIRRYVPELADLSDQTIHEPWRAGGAKTYPPPMVDHAKARLEAIAFFKGNAPLQPSLL